MVDQFSEITSESWFGRIGSSITGILFGLIFIALSIVLLSWNESRGITTAKSLKEGAAAVISVDAAAPDPANNHKLIHVSGEATTTEVIRDPVFAVSAVALRIDRNVTMYQWKEEVKTETTKTLGGGTETVKTYTYDKVWTDKRIDSSHFKHPEDHSNPGGMLAESSSITALHAMLGAFRLPPSIIAKMKGDEPLTPTEDDLGNLNPALKAKAKLGPDCFYFGADPTAPAIGDQRVIFKNLKPAVFSIVAQQTDDTFAPYPTHAGKEIERVECGTISAAAMFQHAASENAVLTWIIRGVGFIVMTLGIGLILNPISVFADVIPFLGSILGIGVAFSALMLGLVGSLITIAVAWFVVRPVLSGALLALALAWLLFGRHLGLRCAPAAKSR